MSDDRFDAIIVGAGVAGSTAAYLLAQQGLQVVLVERGPYPGSKNLSGGVLYTRVLEHIFPNYAEEAPLERCITRQVISFLGGDASFNVDFKNPAFLQPPYNAFTVLRAKFDRWLAEQAEAAGALLVPGIKVEQVIKDGAGRVVGVLAGEDELMADVVIAADGATSFLAQQAGLRGRIDTKHVATGVKAVVGLPQATIEDRFHLDGNEGVAYTTLGAATRGVAGGGFVYTNRESLSVGLVMRLDDLVRTKSRPAEIFDEFLAHPAIAPLLKDGELLEYGAHLVPEGGLEMIPQLYTDGMLVAGDAAGLVINNGFAIRGMDLAIGSAVAAAQAVVEAREANDFSARSLSRYKAALDRSFVMRDMRTYSRAPHFLDNPRLFKQYPELLADMMTRIYTQNAEGKQPARNDARQSLKDSHISLAQIARDVLEGARAL